jgi:hypothetical protein
VEPKKWFDCTCEGAEHCFRVAYFEGEKPKDYDVYISVHLSPNAPWYKRIWVAIKYIFGKRSPYGDFDEIILDNKQVIELRDMLTDYIEQEIPNEAEKRSYTFKQTQRNKLDGL